MSRVSVEGRKDKSFSAGLNDKHATCPGLSRDVEFSTRELQVLIASHGHFLLLSEWHGASKRSSLNEISSRKVTRSVS